MFENAIQDSIRASRFDTEKTFIDKILAKEDIEKVRELVKKPRLTRSELLELLYLIASTESKLVNFDEYQRYVALKFFVWIREFIKVCEFLFDYQDDLTSNVTNLTTTTEQLLNNITRRLEHNAKFLIDLYLIIARTTLSLGATGFGETLKNKYEVNYRDDRGYLSAGKEEKKGFSKWI
jgi:hypothetical protein